MLDHIESSDSELNEINNLLTTNLGFDWIEKEFILITGHRRENFGEDF